MQKTFLLIITTCACLAASVPATTFTVQVGADLQTVIDYASSGDTIILTEKTFEARPSRFTDSLCGNCQENRTPVQATRGFVVKDKVLTFIGKSRTQSRLVTNAGYGLYFENSPGSAVRNLTITGGRRDPDGMATDAAIVVRYSQVEIVDCDIINNNHLIDTVVVGVGGVFGREGAEIVVRNCRLENNGWDGIALYRGATATVVDCLIKSGRGVGIGVTWDSQCIAYRNVVTGYWKGIGAFASAWVIARNNLIHENLGWGMVADGQSYMDITNNVIYHNGNCGIAPWGTESRGRIVNNIVVANGWRDEWVCPCVGIYNYGDWAKWKFAHNIVWDNKEANYHDIWDHTGLAGNISEDPMFVGDGSFRVLEGSPAIHGGDSTIYNLDGTVSHIGLYGGPQARPR